MGMIHQDTNFLFTTQDELRMDLFGPKAKQVLWDMYDWLREQNRRMFLPLDLLIVLIDRGHHVLGAVVTQGAHESHTPQEVLTRLRALAQGIEEEPSSHEPTFERSTFSRGFTRIIMEAHTCAQERGSDLVRERDLVRCVLWRAEATESASVRWAMRRLSEGGGDQLFDEKGLLRQSLFDAVTWDVLFGAMMLASAHGTPFLGTPHLIATLCTVRNSTIWRSAKARGLDPSRLREELLRLIGAKTTAIPEFILGRKTLTPRMVRMLSLSVSRATTHGITEDHLVEAFLEDGGSSLELIQALGLESEVRRVLGEPTVLEKIVPVRAVVEFNARKLPSPMLDLLGRDLTQEAMEGRLPDIVGREKELERVINVLLRQEQRNPLLTGEAGVGKTALAIALAQRIASGKVFKKLKGYRVVEINGANLMSGTSYRGDLESRIQGVLEEASRDVILFIDEAHAVFAPRSGSQGPAEVPNHFKSALASGQIAVVAATTESEYRRWIEQDPALRRRFERIEVHEPSHALSANILRALVPEFELEYDVKVDPDAIDATIELSTRFMPEQKLPDKAKKLLMDACISKTREVLEDPDAPKPVVDALVVAQQVHTKTGVPMDRLSHGAGHWWGGIKARLSDHVVGQPHAISTICRALVSARLRSANARRPLAVMAFYGPAGVGKGTMAQALAVEVFSRASAMIRLDMTDYQESHSMSRLIGSPPGYVGYEDEDGLVTPLRRQPSSVILFEDFDKAHPQVQDRILKMLREGEITDTRGQQADARNAIFILTVNTSPESAPTTPIGFDAQQGSGDGLTPSPLPTSLERRLRQNVDALVAFERFQTREDGSAAESLLDRHVKAFIDGMKLEYDVHVTLDDSLERHMSLSARELDSARDVAQLVEALLFGPMTRRLLEGLTASSVSMVWADGAVLLDIGDEGCEQE